MTQKEAFKKLKSGANVFLTGPPGSGKTHLLRRFISYLRSKDIEAAVTASTGIAATHIQGRTIHSWSGVGVKEELTGEEITAILKKPDLRDRIINSKVLIVDEISMMNPAQFGLADVICRRARNSAAPFGGLQVVLSGDFFQLPPVRPAGEDLSFVTDTKTWQELELEVCYLDEQYRQIDDRLSGILQDIRRESVSEDTVQLLKERLKKEPRFKIDPTRLYTHNKDVDLINSRKLEELKGKPRTYHMKEKGEKPLTLMLKKSCLAPETLQLKKGAKVMFVKNDFKQGYVNGTLGEVVGFNDFSAPVVETQEGKKIEPFNKSWRLKEGGVMKAEIRQIPLRLAWAITVHKSQGMTLDCAEIDLRSAFEKGMGYVALSRVKKLSGIDLKGFNRTALEINKKAARLDKRFQRLSP